MLRGFDKRYFMLLPTLVYPAIYKLRTHAISTQTLFRLNDHKNSLKTLDTTLQTINSYRCNCYYKYKARLVLLLNHFIPRCPYYTTFYAFRRTGIHPPV
ncbi:MAG: hypothetical protein LGB72_02665 [Sulfurovum sp.]|nr:hypothetical protein [Sulfurovum sp.]MCB4764514.1 hypothetical protein [Sulfurovum sp.]MCB4777106.1 hypothetical protein [Sulfurovum sp.]